MTESINYDQSGAGPGTAQPGQLVGLITAGDTPVSCTNTFVPGNYQPGTWTGPQVAPVCS